MTWRDPPLPRGVRGPISPLYTQRPCRCPTAPPSAAGQEAGRSYYRAFCRTVPGSRVDRSRAVITMPSHGSASGSIEPGRRSSHGLVSRAREGRLSARLPFPSLPFVAVLARARASPPVTRARVLVLATLKRSRYQPRRAAYHASGH